MSRMKHAGRLIAESVLNATGGAPANVGIAVSGGGDSMALLHLINQFLSDRLRIHAVTVDHGLRPDSAAEAAFVAENCARIQVPHSILTWQGWDGAGNLQDAARKTRYTLIRDWAQQNDIGTVLLGHTADDQAETILMRFARGSGVDGLSGMAERLADSSGLTWLRPLMNTQAGLGRRDVRQWLRDNGHDWIDDPSNEDPRFDRILTRRFLENNDLGITPTRLLRLSKQMRGALPVLESAARRLAETARVNLGGIRIDRRALDLAAEDTRFRVMAAALCFVSGQSYRPRFDTLVHITESGGTLHGCRIEHQGTDLMVYREFRAIQNVTASPSAAWDGHWKLSGPFPKDSHIAALGPRGRELCPDWRSARLPAAWVEATPAIWSGRELIAAPIARPDQSWTVHETRKKGNFVNSFGQEPGLMH